MSGSYTAFEVEAERRRELVEHSLQEAAERRMLDEADRGSHERRESAQGRGLAEFAAGLFSRVSERA